MYAACAQAKKARVDVEFGFTPFNVAHLVALKLASVALVGFAAWACLGGTLPLWMFLAIALLSFTIFGGVEGVADSAHMLGDLNDVLDRLDKIEQARFIDEDGRALDLDRFDIAFEDVAFSYDEGPEARTVLHDVSFAIPEGTTCAIVGPSGSGKTTIANLMARFWDVSAGSVRVGGHDVREFTCDSLLANFSMVFQNVYLFNDTVEANIAFGCPGASHDEVVAAAKRACCHGFIEELPQGYDTVVGEGGSSLSGGQKQRISIARALLKDAPIVVLDEACLLYTSRLRDIPASERLECFVVPLIMSATTTADELSRAATCRGIENPVRSTDTERLRMHAADWAVLAASAAAVVVVALWGGAY